MPLATQRFPFKILEEVKNTECIKKEIANTRVRNLFFISVTNRVGGVIVLFKKD